MSRVGVGSLSARGCTTTADSLHLPFTCGLATGEPLASVLPAVVAAPIRTHLLTWSDVAAGMMLNQGVLQGARHGRAALERELLLRSRKTWMPLAPNLEILLLATCPAKSGGAARQYDRHDTIAPTPRWWLPSEEVALPKMQWRCFGGRDTLGVSLWRKTGALLAVLLRTHPTKRYYLKIDSDTMLLPNALLAFLRSLHAATPRGVPLYFGSNRIASRRRFCLGPRCLMNTPAWRSLEKNTSSGGSGSSGGGSGGGGGDTERGAAYCESSEASYAQGGAYGFDRRALMALVHDACLERVASAVRAHDGARDDGGAQLFEDEAVGLCMRLRRVRLVTCGCFYDWGPCDVSKPTASCRPDTNASRLCHFPLTVHKLRQLSWFDGWWALLSKREPAALRALGAWEADKGRQPWSVLRGIAV